MTPANDEFGVRPRWVAALHALLLRRVAGRRPPDFVIGGEADPYLRRWWVIPRNRWFNVYLHHFCRSDDDRALHDHPWWNASLLLSGNYIEHRPGRKPIWRQPGVIYLRRATAAHRIELLSKAFRQPGGGLMWLEKPVWTLFITGPKVRDWGFLCPRGWRHWREFTGVTADGRNDGSVGRGCE